MANVAEMLGEVVGHDRILPPESLPLPDYLTPAAVVYPTTEAELSAVMACAHGHRWRVIPCGSGSKLAWGGIGSGVDLIVSTARLNQVIDHAVGDMTLTAQAGVKLADLAPRLAQYNQFLAVDPAYPDRATLGGIVATADTGSLRQRYGGLRDMLIGLSFVRYDGAIAKAGGRVVKNVAGYDLMKLMSGSYGTLGVISQLTFRLYPGQETSKTVVVTGSADAVQALVNQLRLSPLTPVCLDMLSPALADRVGYGGFALLARFQSVAAGVDEQVRALSALVGPDLVCQVVEGEADETLWAAVRDAFFGQSAAAQTVLAKAVLAKVGLQPPGAAAWLEGLPSGSLARIHVGSGIGTVRLAEGTAQLVEKLRFNLGVGAGTQASGYLTLLEAPPDLKQSTDVWGYSGNALGVMGAIKAQFDPHHTLSPGRFVGGL